MSGSAVALWAGLGPITAALLGHRRAALGLAAGYALLMAAAGLVPTPAAPAQPAWLREGLFALNLAAVPLVAFLFVRLFAGDRASALTTGASGRWPVLLARPRRVAPR